MLIIAVAAGAIQLGIVAGAFILGYALGLRENDDEDMGQ